MREDITTYKVRGIPLWVRVRLERPVHDVMGVEDLNARTTIELI